MNLRGLFTSGSAGTFLAIFAATHVAAAESPTKIPTPEEVVEISPFVVNASQDVGYLAGNTLAGSRMNTPLKDTAASISVMTEEMIKDLGATNLTEVLQYGSNVQWDLEDAGSFNDNTSGGNAVFSQASDNFRIRGQRASKARNYFTSEVGIDSYNLTSVEEARGPNSILFGVGSAGGVINSSTKQAVTNKSFRNASLMGDSNDSYRGTLDLNQAAFNNKLGVRVNAVYSDAKTYRLFQSSKQKRIDLALKYDLTPTTRIRADYETGLVQEVRVFSSNLHDGPSRWLAAGRPTYDTPVAVADLAIKLRPTTRRATFMSDGNPADNRLVDTAGTAVLSNSSFMIIDHNIVDPTVNVAGPGNLARQSFDTPTVFLEQQFGKKTFLELAYNHQKYRARNMQPQGDAAFLDADVNRKLRDGTPNPFVGKFFIETSPTRWDTDYRADDYRATLSSAFDYGKWGDYRLAGLAEYQRAVSQTAPMTEAWVGAPFGGTPESAANQVIRRGYATEGNWATYHVPMPGETGLITNMTDPVSGRTLSSTWVHLNNSVADDPMNQKTWMVGGQARYFDGRLVAGFGYRHDSVHVFKRNAIRNPVTQEWMTDYSSGISNDTDGSTKTLGLVAHVTKQISLTYNVSSNIALPPPTQRHTVTGEPLSPAHGKGMDAGLGFNLLDGKLYARATYFKSNAENTNAIRFGGTNTNPNSVALIILDTLRNAGAITQADEIAHTPAVGTSSYLDNVAEGFEYSLTGNPTRNWRLMATYTNSTLNESDIATDVRAWFATETTYWRSFNRGSVVTGNAGNSIDAVIGLMQDAITAQTVVENRGAVGNRRHKVSLLTRYSFSEGRLKGLYAGGGYRHQSKLLVGKDFNDQLQYGNSYWLADAFLGYQNDGIRWLKNWNFQLNVTNVFDADEPLITRLTPEVPVPHIKQQIEQAPRMWRLTANFAF